MRIKPKTGGGVPAVDDGGKDVAAHAPSAPSFDMQASLMSSGTLEHCKNHPRMLKSNATSHVWSLGALAELIDNAQDDEAQYVHLPAPRRAPTANSPAPPGKPTPSFATLRAKNVYVSGGERNGDHAITVEDDGKGMTRPKLHCMLSFGFLQTEHLANNVGRFGIGGPHRGRLPGQRRRLQGTPTNQCCLRLRSCCMPAGPPWTCLRVKDHAFGISWAGMTL